MPQNSFDGGSTLVQVMATRYYLGQCWPRSPSHNMLIKSAHINSSNVCVVSVAAVGTPHSGAVSSFSHQVMSLGAASTAGCSVCTEGDRDEGGWGREGEGGWERWGWGWVGLGWVEVGWVGVGWGGWGGWGEERGQFCDAVVLLLTLKQILLDALSIAVWGCCVALRLALFVSLVRYGVVVRPISNDN